ncbi:MAG: hypothetical protein V3V15_05445 [Sphingorhabdus sp.]
MASTDGQLLSLIREEIEALHAFIAGWFRGAVAHDRALFDAQLASRFSPSLINIQPAGKMLSCSALTEAIFDGYGSNPDFDITICDVGIIDVSADQSRITALYEERQSGARNTVPAGNRRLSSVIFARQDGGGLLWLHIHETMLA